MLDEMERIPEEVLVEQYYMLMHNILEKLQHRFRELPEYTTWKEIGNRIGMAPAVVSRCISGQENMKIQTMHKLARGMGCRLHVDLEPLCDVRPSNRPISARAQKVTQGTVGSATDEMEPLVWVTTSSRITPAMPDTLNIMLSNDHV